MITAALPNDTAMTARIQTLPCGSRSNASNRAPSAPTYQRAARDATIVVSGYTAAVLADTDLTFRRNEWIVDDRRSASAWKRVARQRGSAIVTMMNTKYTALAAMTRMWNTS